MSSETVIKVFEEYKPERMMFEKKEDFIKYLSIHLSDVKQLSTYKLNKKFSVKGYRITKVKGEISLVANHYLPKNVTEVKETKCDSDLKILDDKINFIIDVLKEKHIIDIDEGYEGNGEEDNV
jgi:hypothetical protein